MRTTFSTLLSDNELESEASYVNWLCYQDEANILDCLDRGIAPAHAIGNRENTPATPAELDAENDAEWFYGECEMPSDLGSDGCSWITDEGSF